MLLSEIALGAGSLQSNSSDWIWIWRYVVVELRHRDSGQHMASIRIYDIVSGTSLHDTSSIWHDITEVSFERFRQVVERVAARERTRSDDDR